jgi:hypothetical protein
VQRYGPHKLAKAFAFCLGNASHSFTDHGPQFPPLGAPDKGLASPQSLCRVSLGSPIHPVELHPQGECFPIGAGFSPGKPSLPSEGNKALAVATYDSKATTRRPVLLLVEDNYINLKVCLDHEEFWQFLLLAITSIRTNSGKAS